MTATAADPIDGDGLVRGADGRLRCAWADRPPDYRAYHDDEWGRPVHGDSALLERLVLEGFQSGLSWLTILPFKIQTGKQITKRAIRAQFRWAFRIPKNSFNRYRTIITRSM